MTEKWTITPEWRPYTCGSEGGHLFIGETQLGSIEPNAFGRWRCVSQVSSPRVWSVDTEPEARAAVEAAVKKALRAE